MANYNWHVFLKQWSKEFLNSAYFVENLPYFDQEDYSPEVIASGWLGYPGATQTQITKLETYLGTTLPPSYQDFLKVSNGWRGTGRSVRGFLSTDEIDWFAVKNQDWIDAYNPASPDPIVISDEEYFVYGEGQGWFRTEYLQSALEISQIGDSEIYLLNPEIVNSDGEWEAWFFANWLPGATRYRSFWELMKAEYEEFRILRKI